MEKSFDILTPGLGLSLSLSILKTFLASNRLWWWSTTRGNVCEKDSPEFRKSLNHTVTFVILVPAPRADDNPKALELSGRLNQLDKDLAQAEKNTLSSLRAPLNRSDPATDLTNRLKEQEVRQVWLTYFIYCLVTDSWILIITFLFSKQKTAAALQQLEKQRATAQKDLEPLLSHDINGPTFSTLPQKLNDAKNKQDSLAALNDLHRKKYVICSITQLYNSVWNKPQFLKIQLYM